MQGFWKKTRQSLTDFNAHRNVLSHNLYGIKKKIPTKKETARIFEEGLSVASYLPVIQGRFLHVEGKKNPKFKKAFKKIFGFAF
jgi:ABC-type lipoprotein release transport system permease subunit